jgi:SHS2 domain-containing protein
MVTKIESMIPQPETRNSKLRYRVFDHTADLGLEIYGGDERELFSNAAFALFDIITDINSIDMRENRYISIEGSDREDLLVNFLREILYLFNREEFLSKGFSISTLDSHHLTGEVKGECFDPEKHRINTEIKAVTYHQVKVQRTPQGWKGRIICDV